MHLLHQHLARLAQAVDIGVVAVALVGQRFHRAVLQVALAVAEHAEEDAAFGFLLDQLFQRVKTTGADIEIAIRAEDHAVDALFDEVLLRLGVGEFDTARAVGAAAGL